MDIVNAFRSTFSNMKEINTDLCLTKYDENVMFGVDRHGNIVIVVKSFSPKKKSVSLNTKLLRVESNVSVSYELDGKQEDDIVNILRCFSKENAEQNAFLELAILIIRESSNYDTTIIEAFNLLKTLFEDKKEISNSELIGLYGELFTIYIFDSKYYISRFWQSVDKMKFDFSMSENKKLEIKTTVKDVRIHSFKYEQLFSDKCEIFVLSYLMRFDDMGLSLYDLLTECKKIYENDLKRIVKINHYLVSVDEDRLKSFKINKEYLLDNMKFYSAKDIPKISCELPSGVTNVSFNSDLENVLSKTEEEVFDALMH